MMLSDHWEPVADLEEAGHLVLVMGAQILPATRRAPGSAMLDERAPDRLKVGVVCRCAARRKR